MVLEEDEGFSDWSHRLENRQEQEVQDVFRAQQLRPSAPQCKPEAGEEKQQEEEEEGEQEPELRSQEAPEPSQRLPEKVCDSLRTSLLLSRSEKGRLPALLLFYSRCSASGRKSGRRTAHQSFCHRTTGCSTPEVNQRTGRPTWRQGR